jgi:hypothetical protein
LTCGTLSAQNAEHGVRNIVLVHGAWADGSGWRAVYDILVRDGFDVSIVQEPETSFQDDVTAEESRPRRNYPTRSFSRAHFTSLIWKTLLEES